MSIYWHLGWSVAEIPLQRDKRRQFCPSLAQTWIPVSIAGNHFLSNKLKSSLHNGVSRARAGMPSEAGCGIADFAIVAYGYDG